MASPCLYRSYWVQVGAFSFYGCHPLCRGSGGAPAATPLDRPALPDDVPALASMPDAVDAVTADAAAPTARVLKRRAAAKEKRKTRSKEEHAEAERDRRRRRKESTAADEPRMRIVLPDYAATNPAWPAQPSVPAQPPASPSFFVRYVYVTARTTKS